MAFAQTEYMRVKKYIFSPSFGKMLQNSLTTDYFGLIVLPRYEVLTITFNNWIITYKE